MADNVPFKPLDYSGYGIYGSQMMDNQPKSPEGYTLNPDGTVSISQEVQAEITEALATHYAQEKLLKSYSLWTLEQRQKFLLKNGANPYVRYAAQNTPVDLTVHVSLKRDQLPGQYRPEERRIYAPYPDTAPRLLVYMHEIGHSTGISMPWPPGDDVACEWFALKAVRSLGLSKPTIRAVEKRACTYILTELAECQQEINVVQEAKSLGLDAKEHLDSEILEFLMSFKGRLEPEIYAFLQL